MSEGNLTTLWINYLSLCAKDIAVYDNNGLTPFLAR